MPLKIEKLTSREAIQSFSLGGRLDNKTARELEKALQPALQANPKSIVLRMNELEFISSAGIRVLIETQNTLSAKGGTVLLVDMQPQIQKVLEIIKALPGISVFRNVQEMDDYLETIQRKVKSGE